MVTDQSNPNQSLLNRPNRRKTRSTIQYFFWPYDSTACSAGVVPVLSIARLAARCIHIPIWETRFGATLTSFSRRALAPGPMTHDLQYELRYFVHSPTPNVLSESRSISSPWSVKVTNILPNRVGRGCCVSNSISSSCMEGSKSRCSSGKRAFL